ncbi:MAG TPA: alpha/beta fold hydrolase [Steroidobacteraceae bacterium]|nr:alpha/beta fold hydrolase [Steroidobacteraceae bacterium]
MPETPPPSLGDLHDDQIVALLRSGAHAALLMAYFGEQEYRELSQLAKLAATRRNPRGRRVFVLPGIMGSRLGLVARRTYSLLWLHPTALANGELAQLALPGPRALRAVGVMLPGYLKLRLRLEIAGFRPLFCPFDWRQDIERLARTFAQTIERSGERKALVVGHSMGGLVARAALAHDKKRRIARLIQLGAPNDGSFAPLQALRAVYPTVRKIAALDRNHTAEQLARLVYHTLPGIYQMLPAGGELDLFDAKQWPGDELSPDVKLLARARKVRARLPAADQRCSVIIGAGQETIVSVALRGGAFEYEYRAEGDGTVPLERARWAGAATWFVNENHGALTQNDVVLGAVADILKSGDTRRLRTTAPRPADVAPRRVTDDALRAAALHKVQWEKLSLESRRRILEPVLTPEFLAPPA